MSAGTWFGPGARPLCGWWSPAARDTSSAVVVLSPIGYEYWSAHRSLRTLAERLAERGYHALRFDYDGTGDSAGDCWDPDRVAAWRASALAAVAEVRARGADHVTLVGARFGATLALSIGAEARADRVVAWAPVVSGKRFARELKMLGLAVPDRDGAMIYAGTGFTADTAAELARIDLDKLAELPAPRVLVIAQPDKPCDKLVARLRELGADAEQQAIDGRCALEVPSEDAVVPVAVIDAIANWIGEAAAARTAFTPVHQREARIGDLTETIVDLDGLVAIETRTAPSDTAIVFLNSGSEVHVGPGRAWVDYARALARAGYTAVRVDWSGWGESPDRGHAPGRPYDPHCLPETERIVATLRARGANRVVLAGLCAGAWIAVHAALRTRIDGIVAINPQLYWNVGDPVEALMSDTRKRRTPIRARDERLKKWWPVLDVLGIRPPAARWLSGLTRARTPALLLFAQGDDGIEYLETRVARRLEHERRRGFVRVEQIADIDHQMYRVWRRPDVIATLRRALADMAAA